MLYGATGFTGRLTAHALGEIGASFAMAGRSRGRLDEIASAVGESDVRVVAEGSVDSLVDALQDVRVLVTCVGPFLRFGHVAVEAALKAGVHYIDSTGEPPFIGKLVERDADARAKGIAMAPALGFDEVPADVAATLATEGMSGASLTLTYALPRQGSWGTMRSAIPLLGHEGPWLEAGSRKLVRPGYEDRWAPMPPPLGPRRAIAYPLGEAHLAPRHLDLSEMRTYITMGNAERVALRYAGRVLGLAVRAPGAATLIDRLPGGSGSGPDEAARRAGKWTILAEARDQRSWRNVALMGSDAYGLTARTLATAAVTMAAPGYDRSGVLSPVQATGLETLRRVLDDEGVTTQIYQDE